MAKGFFTQGVVILLEHPLALSDLRPLLAPFTIAGQVDTASDIHFGGPSLVLSYRPEVNGRVSIDIVPSPWPDHMGDPQSDSTLFGAWTMGFYGPFTFPRGLHRATQQSWRWADAASTVARHRAFLRIRTSYVLGGGESAPVLPPDYAPLPELDYLCSVTSALLAAPGALAYFNPAGEIILPPHLLPESLAYHRRHDLPPLDLWSNIRLYQIDHLWTLMDSVGNWQFDLPDQEIAFPRTAFEPSDTDRFIRNLTLYLLRSGRTFADGDTINGPGNIPWRARHLETPLTDPPRPVTRWLPTSHPDLPPPLIDPPQK